MGGKAPAVTWIQSLHSQNFETPGTEALLLGAPEAIDDWNGRAHLAALTYAPVIISAQLALVS
jgi:hypothetical protein